MSKLRTFRPTHHLTVRAYPDASPLAVMLDADAIGEGPAYTESEYNGFSNPLWRFHEGEWQCRCQTVPVDVVTVGDKTQVTVLSKPSLTGAQSRAEQEWPDVVMIRSDESFAIRDKNDTPRLYADRFGFCRAWQARIRFEAPVGVRTKLKSFTLNHLVECGSVDVWGYTSISSSFAELCRHFSLDAAEILAWPSTIERDPDWCTGVGIQELHNWRERMLSTFGRELTEGSAVDRRVEINPEDVVPLRGALDKEKLDRLARIMEVNGWIGRPVLVERTSFGAHIAWTGRHRIRAARTAKLRTIPAILLDTEAWALTHGSPGLHGAILDTRDEIHRTQMLSMTRDHLGTGLLAVELLG